ncbi:MAG: hypothetical protein LBT46_14950 [Planctomycetaceae bacterium]|jgi:hypothetical protein|nr:hypothetical protein [Planctomycetaceae bacterium]
MLPKSCGKLLYNAVRETLETMAFADVVPCSIKVAGEEVAQDDDFRVSEQSGSPAASGWGDETDETAAPADAWGTAVPQTNEAAGESWGDSPLPATTLPAESAEEDAWGTVQADTGVVDDAEWGNSGITVSPEDPWGDAVLAEQAADAPQRPQEADFDNMVDSQTAWCWACMKVNSPDIHSVWFIVPKSLADALAQNMYAGEVTEMDTPVIRDLVAELTNVLGGRLMLLLEEMGGRFTLTVPEIGFGLPDIPETAAMQNVICKIVVDGEHPIITALCFNPGSTLAAG